MSPAPQPATKRLKHTRQALWRMLWRLSEVIRTVEFGISLTNVNRLNHIGLCKKGRNRSSFRFVNVEQLKHFKWEALYDDLKMRAAMCASCCSYFIETP